MRYINEVFYDRRRDFFDSRNKEITPNQFDIIFLGDSITEGFNFSYMGYTDKKILNSGISGDRLLNLHHRIYLDAINHKPKTIVIHMGINDLTNELKEDDQATHKLFDAYVSNTKEILNNNIRPVLIGLIKIDQFCHNSAIINEQIKELNNQLLEYCNKNNITFIDYNEVLSDEYDSIENTYFTDGLHLNDKGYFEMFKLLKKRDIL